MNRNHLAGIVAVVLVLAAIVVGFWSLGGPGRQRKTHQDDRTVQALAALAVKINASWTKEAGVLPENLDRFAPNTKRDPTTHVPFLYHRKTGSRYELCASFLTDNRDTAKVTPDPFWLHPEGAYCFQLDASVSPPTVPYNYSY